MDEEIIEKYNNLAGAHAALEESFIAYESFLKQDQSMPIGGVSYDIAVNLAQRGLIQAFEVMIELFPKYLRGLLELYDASVPASAPTRDVIAKVVQLRLLTEEEGDLLLFLIKWRNKTSHIYHEAMCDQFVCDISISFVQISDIIGKIKPVASKDTR